MGDERRKPPTDLVEARKLSQGEPSIDAPYYMVMGECYVHMIMDGETTLEGKINSKKVSSLEA
jgi:hypothetical protein